MPARKYKTRFKGTPGMKKTSRALLLAPLMALGLAGMAPVAAQAGDEFGVRFTSRPPAALTDEEPAAPQNIEPAAGGEQAVTPPLSSASTPPVPPQEEKENAAPVPASVPAASSEPQ